MFLSTIQPEYAMEFKDIRDYVLNKDATKFDNSKYRINMYLLKKIWNKSFRGYRFISKK